MKRSFLYLFYLVITFYACTIRDKKKDADPVPAVFNPYQPAMDMIKDAYTLVKEGDLVMRNGQEFSSQLIRGFSKTDKTYSHAGVIIFENGYPMVYHILAGGESLDEKFRKDSLSVFCNPRKNFGFGIYRYDLDTAELQRYENVLLDWYKKGVSFDMDFDYKTDDKMYCSEMIAKALAIATKNRVAIKRTSPTPDEAIYFSTKYNHPLEKVKKLEVVALDNLYLIAACHMIKQYKYEPAK